MLSQTSLTTPTDLSIFAAVFAKTLTWIFAMSSPFVRPTVMFLAVAVWSASVVAADTDEAIGNDGETNAAGIALFESKIRPVLARHCYDCHSARQAADEGGLQLDSKTAIRRGGGRGPAIVPGRPEESLLIAVVSHGDPELRMPPKSPKLPRHVIAAMKQWISIGAPYPAAARSDHSAANAAGSSVMNAAETHWAYQRPTTRDVPEVDDDTWGRDPVDAFVLSRLREAGLSPSKDASPPVLLRRLHFALVGLPPSLDSQERFSASVKKRGIDAALGSEVDRLLSTPQFGERWGRHWMDVARFAESSGGESNISFPYAWRYRDYVIDSVNDDIGFDRFLEEQIAGDLLTCDSDEERARLLTATGFLAVGTKNLGENDEEQFAADIVDEQIDTLTRSVLANSVACARCHDHKFDPFLMEDYYALAGIFHSTKTYFGTFTSPANRRSGDPLPLPRVEGQQIFQPSITPKRLSQLKERLAELNAEWAEMQDAQGAMFAGMSPKKKFTLREVLANIWRRGPIEGKLETVDDQGRALPLAMGVLDRAESADAPLLARGDIRLPGPDVPRAFPRAIAVGQDYPIPNTQSGRLELARWLTDAQHPLTSRVFVNRVWQHLFGSGIVATVDNFGTGGSLPTHPRLLDTLAVEFVSDGWSLKRLVRRLVLTRTWRQSSEFQEAAFQVDPENRWLWRMPKRRLEAEAIRDAMLSVSGQLESARPEGSLVARVIGDKPISLIGLNKRLPTDLDGSLHRSVYLPVIRDRLPDVLELFDFAEPSLVTGKRDETNVPVQSLYLMNSDFVHQRASALARRVGEASSKPRRQIAFAYRICFGREPTREESDRGIEFLKGMAGELDDVDQAARTLYSHALLSTFEFRSLD